MQCVQSLWPWRGFRPRANLPKPWYYTNTPLYFALFKMFHLTCIFIIFIHILYFENNFLRTRYYIHILFLRVPQIWISGLKLKTLRKLDCILQKWWDQIFFLIRFCTFGSFHWRWEWSFNLESSITVFYQIQASKYYIWLKFNKFHWFWKYFCQISYF